MPNTRAHDHTDEFEQSAGLSALGVLEGDELAVFAAHLERCERCQLVVRLDREALARVSLVAPGMDPSPDFKERLMRRAAQELAAAPARSEVTPTPLRTRPTHVVSFWRRSPWLSAVAAVFVVALVSGGAFAFENQTVATYQLTGSAPGTAKVVMRRSGDAELDMNGVPNPEPGYVYEAWIIPPGAAKPIAAGITNTGEAKLKLTGDLRGATVAVTKERGQVDAPTSDVIMKVVVQS